MMKKALSFIAMCVLVMVVMDNVQMTNAATCNAQELLPCAVFLVSGATPSVACCSKLKAQQPCFCEYVKDPRVGQNINSPNAKKIVSACGVSFPKSGRVEITELIVDKIRVQMDAFLEDGSHEATIAIFHLSAAQLPTSNMVRPRDRANAFCEAIRALDATVAVDSFKLAEYSIKGMRFVVDCPPLIFCVSLRLSAFHDLLHHHPPTHSVVHHSKQPPPTSFSLTTISRLTALTFSP
ncbi:hypothetical protein L1887_35969 [Cichorium endivia]|nr:hypothetical protein L1887_35969 [Cichorium endivia]